MDFTDIVGHEEIIKHFKSSIEQNKVGHAYIISGEVDSGKKMLARTFAATLQCETGESSPCHKCKSCIKAESGNHPDIITITHEKPNIISVDEIRTKLVDDISTKPYESRYKIYIVPDAELMNTQAQNALLKTIEEPPKYAVILLLTANPDRLLETVKSRCIMLTTRPVRERDMLAYLKGMGLSEDKAYFCLDFAQGNLGKAIKLAGNEEYNRIIDSVVSVLKKIHTMDVDDLGLAIKAIQDFKLSINDYLDLMIMWYRDVLMLKVTGSVDKLLFKAEYNSLRTQASLMSYSTIEDKISAIEIAKQRLVANANFDVTIELLLLTLKENAQG
jgi:DNA polymerase-3 subunit delta'